MAIEKRGWCGIRACRHVPQAAKSAWRSIANSLGRRTDDRLLLTLWHLAEHWARVRPAGIVVVLPLSHRRLADLIGADRQSVTTAMGELLRAGSISRRDDGAWVLRGTPPEKLRHHPLGAALT